jgi:AAHS family 4-hydroxybenzoate transporter-like MFS transporter
MPGSQSITNVTDLIDRRPLGALQVRTFLLATLVILLDGANTISITVTAPAIAPALGIPMSAFGPIFSAGQAGLLIGALALGPLADRWGRKSLVLGSTLAFGIFSLVTPLAASFNQLFLMRLLAGIGLGGAAPNAVALVSEYAPKRMRASLVTLMWAAFPLGGVLMGLLGGLDWRTIFYLGGALPLAVAALIPGTLPESPAFLISRGFDSKRIAAIVSRIAPDLRASALQSFSVTDRTLPGVPLKHLFSGGRASVTLLLWVMFFCDFLILVSVNSWTPALLRASGFSVTGAGFAIALNSLGSTAGAILAGRLMDRYGSRMVLFNAFVGAAVSVATLGYATGSYTSIAIFVTLSGGFAGAGQAGVIALAAPRYPVDVRGTGVGWAMALGRLGAVAGPLAGGILLGWNWSVSHTFLAFAVPGLCAGAAVMALQPPPRETLSTAPLAAQNRSE